MTRQRAHLPVGVLDKLETVPELRTSRTSRLGGAATPLGDLPRYVMRLLR